MGFDLCACVRLGEVMTINGNLNKVARAKISKQTNSCKQMEALCSIYAII